MTRRLLLDRRAYLLLGVVSVLVAFAIRGSDAASGMVLGVVGTALNFLGIWCAIRLVSESARKGGNTEKKTLILVLLTLGCIPAIVAFWMVAQSVGGDASIAFLIGLGLVYSALVAWALAAA